MVPASSVMGTAQSETNVETTGYLQPGYARVYIALLVERLRDWLNYGWDGS
jgi:hypothetical protein